MASKRVRSVIGPSLHERKKKPNNEKKSFVGKIVMKRKALFGLEIKYEETKACKVFAGEIQASTELY